jgi:hypothetical protein
MLLERLLAGTSHTDKTHSIFAGKRPAEKNAGAALNKKKPLRACCEAERAGGGESGMHSHV